MVAVHDCSSIYRVPLLLQEQGVLEFFLKRLEIPVLHTRPSYLHKWKNLADRSVQWSPSLMTFISLSIVTSPVLFLFIGTTPSNRR